MVNDFNDDFVPGQRLSEISENDKPWDVHKSETIEVESAYSAKEEFFKYAERMSGCGKFLVFGESADHTGIKLTKAHFCRVRNCPICGWRKSLSLKARFLTNLPAYLPAIAGYNFIHLVLTVENPPMSELRSTIQKMNDALKKMFKRESVLPVVKGFIKSIEVTKGGDGNPHPHFHLILAVNKSYFTDKTYISHKKWVELWRSCLGVDYDPIVNVSKVKEKLDKSVNIPEGFESVAGLIAGMIEVTKYAVKPADVIKDPEFLYGITEQTFKMRFLEAGGCFSGIFKDPRSKKDDISEDDMLLKTENSELTDKRLKFLWDNTAYYLHKVYKENND